MQRRDEGDDVEEPQGTAVKVVTILRTVGRHEYASDSPRKLEMVGLREVL